MKKLFKALILGVFWVLVLPVGLVSRLEHMLFRTAACFEFFSQWYSIWPGLPGRLARACFYQQTLRKAYLDLDIGFGSSISKILTTVGRGVLITGYTTIGYAEIGDRAVIANHVSILSGRYQHNFTDPAQSILSGNDQFSIVHIGNDTFIGENSVVMADVGAYTIVGAGSVVVKPLPGAIVAVGNPARVVKPRNVPSG